MSFSVRSGKQRGFTLVNTVVASLIAGTITTGTWIAYSDMQVQWRISNAERVMDQYAAATMQELTNDLSWAWGAKEIQGGPRNTKWAFYMDDIMQENGLFATWKYQFGPDNALELTFRPAQGILINSMPPKWSAYRTNSQYLWSGHAGAPLGVQRAIDRRDRMTVEGIQIDFQDLKAYFSGTDTTSKKRAEVVMVSMTMHYTYDAPSWYHVAMRLYGDSYIKEREYVTQIAMRNWDVESNSYRDMLLGICVTYSRSLI